MAPVLSRSIINHTNIGSAIPSKNKHVLQSRIPLRKAIGVQSKTPLSISMKSKQKSVVKEEISKSSKIIISRNISGKTNILKPPIKKIPPTSINLDWTKSKNGNSLIKTATTWKAKDIKSRKSFKQVKLPTNYFQRSKQNKQCDTIEKENKKTMPNTKKVQLKRNCHVPTFSLETKALQEELNREFVPSEFCRNQILNNQELTFDQINKENEVVNQLDRLAISSISKSQSSTKPNAFGFSNKHNRIVPSSSNIIRRHTGVPGTQSKRTIDPFQEAMESIRKLPNRKRTTCTPPSNKQTSKKCDKPTPFPSDVIRRCTWAPGTQPKRTVDAFEEAMESIKKLPDRRRGPCSSTSKPKARVSLFQSPTKSSSKIISSSSSKSVTWSDEKQTLTKKLDPYEEAMAQIKKLKSKTLPNRILKSGEKLKNDSSHLLKEKQQTLSSCKQVNGKIVDPYEEAMTQIKELPLRTPPSKRKIISEKSASSKNTKESIKTNLFKHENGTSPLNKTSSPSCSTPRHVKFNLSGEVTPSVYRPLKSLMLKSIMKKQPRLTDISEHSENESLRSSGANMEEFKISLPDLLQTPRTPTTPPITNNYNEIKASSNFTSRFQSLRAPLDFDDYSPKLRKLDTSILKSPCNDISTGNTYINSPLITFDEVESSLMDGCWKLSNSDSKQSNKSVLLHTPKALHPFQSRNWKNSDNLIEQDYHDVSSFYDAPILTPLVLQNIARSCETINILGPIKQKLKFTATEPEELIKKSNENIDESSAALWLRRLSNYNDVLTKSKQESWLADEECASIFENQKNPMSLCRQFLNPIAKTLNFGDNRHFIPIAPEVSE